MPAGAPAALHRPEPLLVPAPDSRHLPVAGYSHVNIDGILVETDRVSTPGPMPEWTCGGRANMPTTAATFRSSPFRTVGRSGSDVRPGRSARPGPVGRWGPSSTGVA